MNRTVFLALLAVAVLVQGALASPCGAASVSLSPGDSIQAAIDGAAPGDIIILNPGRYLERILIGKAITLTSIDPGDPAIVDATIIDGSGAGSVVSIAALTDCILDGITITNGNAGFGGGIYNHGWQGNPVIRNCVITGNTANVGAGIFTNCQPSIINCRITHNTGLYSANGGGIDLSNASAYISGCTIANNTGSGLALKGGMNPPTVVENCVFVGNDAGPAIGSGVITAYSGAKAQITNCLLAGNTNTTRGDGPAIWVRDAGTEVSLSNCTVVNNTTRYGIEVGSGADARFYNLIVWNPDIFLAEITGTPLIEHSIVRGGFAGAGNLSTPPLFVDEANGDYRLISGSPGIDQGDDLHAPAQDLGGNPRPVDGDCIDGAVVDMGALEYLPSDADGDGYNVCADCDDESAMAYPGAPEIRFDGIDQDCNGWDLTIEITKAIWNRSSKTLSVEARSARGANAALVVTDYGLPMTWNGKKLIWSATQRPVAANPGTVTVSGVEGSWTEVVTSSK